MEIVKIILSIYSLLLLSVLIAMVTIESNAKTSVKVVNVLMLAPIMALAVVNLVV